jgi:hypothetical protein
MELIIYVQIFRCSISGLYNEDYTLDRFRERLQFTLFSTEGTLNTSSFMNPSTKNIQLSSRVIS